MSPNLGVGLFDRSFGRFSLARQTPAPKSPQDFGHTFVVPNLADSGFFVKLAGSPFSHICCALTYHMVVKPSEQRNENPNRQVEGSRSSGQRCGAWERRQPASKDLPEGVFY